MEFAEQDGTYQRAFAGDTYNSAVYAKRFHTEMDVQILTAVGADPISAAMVTQWDRDGVGHELVMTSKEAHPGIYVISTDNDGERSFTYWRKASAATELISLLTPSIRQRAEKFSLIYFSGITLAILSDADRTSLLRFLQTLQEKGAKVGFDPNYRPALWGTKDQAGRWFTQAYRLADIAMPGLEDHTQVFGHRNVQEVHEFLEALEVSEIVLKAAEKGAIGYLRDQAPVHLATAQQDPIDTTGAGDSFAGTYLAERLAGVSIDESLKSATRVASLVVQHRGAIVDEHVYRKHLKGD